MYNYVVKMSFTQANMCFCSSLTYTVLETKLGKEGSLHVQKKSDAF